ncbi:uncharacterized protein LOC116247030 [Nymphaea colorata]|nr:uncharacterized protein LOC116247030 [Nymphaea colorata]
MALLLHRFVFPNVQNRPPSPRHDAWDCASLSLPSARRLPPAFSTIAGRKALHSSEGLPIQRCSSSDLLVPTSRGGTESDEKIEDRKQTNDLSSLSVQGSRNSDDRISNSPHFVVDNNAPLVNALKASAKCNAAGFHFPGHNRGRAAPPALAQLIGKRPYFHDLPELPELDNLFSPQGVILDAQRRAAELFGATETWFLVGGTTCGIQASIMATCSPGEILVLPRNSHISAISGMVLSGALPKYIIPEYNSSWDIAGGISSHQVANAIEELHKEGKKPAAVFVTSPTYHGICSNINEITDLCHAWGIPVIVDEAHGAHFKFDPCLPRAALEQGADLVVQSTHKVLCSLTQSSMLHLSGDIVDGEQICRFLQILQSTSPSYLLLASLDAARAQLNENPDTIFDESMRLSYKLVEELQMIAGLSLLKSTNFQSMPEMDPLRVTVGTWKLGVSGYRADEFLCEKHDVIAELASGKSLTFAITMGTCKEHVDRLVHGLKDLAAGHGSDTSRQAMDGYDWASFPDMNIKLSPREASFAKKRRVPIQESVGEICGELVCPYPPGIPILIPGEVVTEDALCYLLDAKNGGAMISGAADPSLGYMLVCSV